MKESTKVQDLSRRLQIREASVISRIFKRGEIRTIKAKIEVKKDKIARIEKKKEKHLGLAKTLKGIASPAPQKA